MRYPFTILQDTAANDNPAAEIDLYREKFKGQLRLMFDNILTGNDPEAMLVIAESEFIRAHAIWLEMNRYDDDPSAA